MSAPLYERIKSYVSQNRISFAMPGHKGGRGLENDLLSLDVTELSGTENLHCGGKYVQSAQRLLSELYGSGESFILTGGSTAAVQSMICGAVKKGGLLLASADCHKSVINACALLGIRVRVFPKEIDGEFGVPLGAKSVKEYITDDTDAVMVTSPNYYGVCSDIKVIAGECRDKGIPLLVDEAHGAHFVADSRFPETAVRYADAVCHSAHKTLNALTGAAYLHLNGSLINRDRTREALTMFQSSSPSYVIAASADTARGELAKGNAWSGTYDMCREFKEEIRGAGVKVFESDDVTRLVLNFSRFGMTGFEVSRALSKKGIDVEMADLCNIVLIVTPSNTSSDLDALKKAIAQIVSADASGADVQRVLPPPPCNQTLSPSDAFFAERVKLPLERAEGRVSCVSAAAYPPGIPVIYTGETIRREHIDYINYILSAGGEVTGLADGKITVTELKE